VFFAVLAKAMGGAVVAAMGVAGGASLGAAVASLLVPGLGPVIVGGLLGAAILGIGGTITRQAAGEALDVQLAVTLAAMSQVIAVVSKPP